MENQYPEQSSKISPGNNPAALLALNELNTRFWSKQSALTLQRISEPALHAVAMRAMRAEAVRVAFRQQKSLDQTLADVEQTRNILLEGLPLIDETRQRLLSRKGGKVLKTDALQILIQACVQKTPSMSQQQLLHHLKKQLGLGTIRAIDNQKIEFLAKNGKLKTVPISGLKDRLFRAKMRINSR